MNKQKKTALIIGCGIAGPAVALFLKRAGIDSVIYEGREQDEGYSLSLSCNGVRILRMLALEDALFAEGSPVSKWSMWSGRCKYLGGGLFTADGIKSVFIKRVPLGKILSDEAKRQGIEIKRGKKLQSVETTQTGGVVATFEDGTSASGDFLIGCDGVHSKTRQFVDPAAKPLYSGLINTGGYTRGLNLEKMSEASDFATSQRNFSGNRQRTSGIFERLSDNSRLTLPQTPETSNFIFGKRAFFGYHMSQSGYVYWFVNYVQPEEPSKKELFEGTEEERKQCLLKLFDSEAYFITDIIQSAETIFPEFLNYTLPSQPAAWHKGPVVLMGDAVHAISPSSGQGASMALEDAVVLAKCLRDIPNLEEAFAKYELLRRERTTKMFAVGERGDSGKFITEPMQQWFRDLTTPIFLTLFANPKASDWIYSYKVDWDSPVSTNGVSR
jgi:2-polyprenyl-6-methoxyphenol hydroxylase-like FAD-dependent oxidoreductase